MRVVLVGFGPVGVRFAEELLPAIDEGSLSLTVIGAEPGTPYNRIMIAEYATGEISRESLEIADLDHLAARGVRVLSGRSAARIDRGAREVVLGDGGRVPYDQLVLATGAEATVPAINGLERRDPTRDGLDPELTGGVIAMRSIGDAERARTVVASGGRIAVLGAGVLGLETALLFADAGARPRLAHVGPAPMPRQLDRGSAHVVTALIDRAGVDIVANVRAEAIITRESGGGRAFHALVSSDGRRIEADLLVLSCGVRPRTRLASDAGLRTSRGILVDDRLRSWSDPRIRAIGDVAHVADPRRYAHEREVPGGPAGLVGAGWRQAEWLAGALIAGEDPSPFAEDSPGIVLLKSRHVDLVQGGEIVPDPFAPGSGEVASWADPRHGTYVAMSTTNGVLDGFVAVGMPRAAAELSLLFQRRGELPSDRSLLLRLDAAEQPVRATGRDETVCTCNAVTAGGIEDAVSDGCDTVDAVGCATRAGTGCGGCRARIAEMIDEWQGQHV
ncbi:MAG: FAD-dependent oxidoreductase [Microbacterium gubbeenense]|uniref:FAD-dependent oxidoreductase n=1 Tax=Microbacterium gubbeenense TaxID=159896 RepID=UPI003F9860E6